MAKIACLGFLFFLCSCSLKSDKKYVIVESHLSTIVDEMNDKEKAFRKASDLTNLAKSFGRKTQYFVLDSQK
jgi:hypothetical protein